jgi:AcrR family transcriptional regulator
MSQSVREATHESSRYPHPEDLPTIGSNGGSARPPTVTLTPRSQRAQITRERIVQAAAEAFDKRGYLGVNLKDVVDELGLTKGALYYFFPAKEDLAVEIVSRHFAAWEPVVKEVSSTFDDKLDALVEISRRVARTTQTDPIARAGTRLSVERNLIHAELPRPFEDWIGGISRLIEEAKSLGQVRADLDPVVTADVVVAFFYGTQCVSRHVSDQADLVARLDRFWELVLPSFRPTSPELQP